MSQQPKQKFQRSTKFQSSTKKIITSSQQSQSLLKNSVIHNAQSISKQTSPKKSEMSIDDAYHFVISQREIYSSRRVVEGFVNRIKRVVAKKQLKWFYRMRLFKLQKQKINAVVPFLTTIVRSIESRKAYSGFMRLKVNLQKFNTKKLAARQLSSFYKRKLKQNMLQSFNNLKSNKLSSKFKDLTQIQQKIQLSLTKDQLASKSLQSINQLLNPNKLLSPRSSQKQAQFNKFTQSIQSNLTKQKDYQLGRINIQNLLKKFGKEQKFRERLKVYEVMMEVVTEMERNAVVMRESSGVLYKVGSFLDVGNVVGSVANGKQIRREVLALRNKLQPNRRVQNSSMISKESGCSNNTIKRPQTSLLQNIQKVTQLLNTLFQHLSFKLTQISHLSIQHQQKLQSFTKQQTQLSKKLQSYHQNQTLLQSLLNNLPNQPQSFTRQLQQVIKKLPRKKQTQFPYSALGKVNDYLMLQKKSMNEVNMALKSYAGLYTRRNLSDEAILQQRGKINVKYEGNQVYSSIESVVGVIVVNAVEKQRQLNGVEIKRLKLENERLVRQIQLQRSKLMALSQSQHGSLVKQSLLHMQSSTPTQTTKPPSIQLSSTTQPNPKPQPIQQQLLTLRTANQQLTKTITQLQSRITELQSSIRTYEKTSLDNDLIKETLLSMLQKVEQKDDTWMKDVEVLKGGRNGKKYEMVVRVGEVIRWVMQRGRKLLQVERSNRMELQQLKKTLVESGSGRGMKQEEQQQGLKSSIGETNCINNNSSTPQITQQQNFSDSFQTLIYNSKYIRPQPHTTQPNHFPPNPSTQPQPQPQTQSPLLLKGYSEQQLPQPQTSKQPHPQPNNDLFNLLNRMSERVSWDISFNPNEEDGRIRSRMTESLMLDNLLEGDGEGLERGVGGVGNNDRQGNSSRARLSQLLLKQQQRQPDNQTVTSNHPLIQQLHQLNTLITLTLTNQLTLQQLAHHLPTVTNSTLTNPTLTNILTLIQTYLNLNQKLSSLQHHTQQLQQFTIQRQRMVRNQRQVNEWLMVSNSDVERGVDERGVDEEYWEGRLRKINQPVGVVVQLTQVMKKLARCYGQTIGQLKHKLQHQQHQQQQRTNLSSHQHQQLLSKISNLTQHNTTLQTQLQHQSTLILSLQHQLKQTNLNYQSQLQYYQRLQQQSYRSPTKPPPPTQKQIKTSRSTRSLKSVDSNTSSKSTKKMQQLKKDYRETLQQMSIQQRRLLLELQRVTEEKAMLLEQVELLVNELKATRQKVIQLEGQLEERQQHQISLKQRYEADFDMLRRDLQNVKLSVSEQVQTKTQQVEYFKQAYQILVTKYNSLITNQNNTITQITNNNSTSPNSKPTTQTPINPPAPSITQLSQQWGSLQYNNRIRQMIQNDVRREYNIRFLQLEQIVNGLTKEREFLIDVIKDKEQLQILLEEKEKECEQQKVKLEEKLINMSQLQYEKQQIQLQFKNVIKQIQALNVKNRQLHEDNQQLMSKISQLQQSIHVLTLKLQQQQQKIQLHTNSYQTQQHHKIKPTHNIQIQHNIINITIPMSTNQSQQIRQVDENTYIVTRTVSGSNLLTNSMREISQVQQLRLRLRQLEQQRNQVIQSEVLKALKAQQQQFNHFYQQNVEKINQHYLNEVIPLKIKQTLNLNLNNSAEGHYTYAIQGSQSTIDHQPTNVKLPFSDARQQQDYLQLKYQQWKLTYLPVILQIKRKQWITEFQSTQLPKIIQLKYAQWQSVRLLAIMREEKNRWVLEQLWGELKGGEKLQGSDQVVREYEGRIREMESNYGVRIQQMESSYELRVKQVERYWEGVVKSKQVQWMSNQQLVINNRVRQVQQYWQTVILPQRLTQYQSHHITLQPQPNTTTTYTQQQLTSILHQQQSKQQLHYQTQLQTQLNLLKQQYQQNIIPQYHSQWQQQFQQQYKNRKQVLQQPVDIEQIIQQKYQQWKQTYLVQYLRIQKQKWLREFRENEVGEIIRKKYEEWEGVRLLAIIKEERNRWIVEGILKQKYQQWQWTILNNQKVKYQKLLQQQSVKYHQLLQQQSAKYQQLLQSKQQQLNNINQLLLTKQHLITQLNTQILSSTQQATKLHSTQQTEHQHTIIIQTKLRQAELHWQSLLTTQRQAFEKALTDERLAFQKTLEEALTVRTQEVEQYWQGVVLPRVKQQWEISYSARDIRVEGNVEQRNLEQEEQRIQREVNGRLNVLLQQRVSHQLNRQLQQHRQLWLKQYLQSQQIRQYISSQHLPNQQQLITQYQTKLTNLRHNIQTQLTTKYTTQLTQLNNIIQTKDLHLQQLTRDIQILLNEKQQLSTQRQHLYQQIQQLQHRLGEQRNNYDLIRQQLQSAQSTSNIKESSMIESMTHKEVIYQMEAKHTQQMNQLQLQYEEKLSQVNLEKSLLSMQLKQLQLNYQKLQTTAKSTKQSITSNSTNIAALQANYQKQLLSLQSTIRTKQSQITFLKKSIDSSTYQNQQLSARAGQLGQKVVLLQQSIDELKGQVVKYQYEIKYWKQKQLSFAKKLQSKQQQHSQAKSRLQQQKSSLQKKLRQSSTTSTTISSLTIKLTQLQSQLSLKHSALKQLQNQTQKKRRQLQQQRQRSFSLLKQIQLYKSTIKQHESIVQDLRLEIRKSCDEINRQKVVIDVWEGKEGQWQVRERALMEQVGRLEHRGKDRVEVEEVIRENQRLRQQLYKTRQHITYLQSTNIKSITSLKQTIHDLTHRLHLSTLHNRSGDITQLQILKRVNTQVTQLVTTNKQLQTRILILQNQKSLTAFGLSIERFFVAFQEQMDNLVNYLVGNGLWRGESLVGYGRFGNRAREALGHGYVEDYFRQWQGFMRQEIEANLEIVDRNQVVRRINGNTVGNGAQLNANDRQLLNTDEQLLEKYDAVLNDVKFTLIQYLKSGQQQYLHIMAKSLGVDQYPKQSKAQLNGQDLSHHYVTQQQKTVIRQ